MSPYSYRDYKAYLADIIDKSEGRGIKASIADAAGCQRSFISQVLNGHVHLTLDHAIGVAHFLRLSPSEVEFFYSMVGEARAATPTLKRFYKDRMRSLKKEGENLSQRLKTTSSDAGLSEYYSTWKFGAIHILCTIPEFQTVATISRKLKLQPVEVELYLNRMKSMGLVKNKGEVWKVTQAEIHLPKNHFMTFINHRNWRDKNLQEASERPDENVTYSAVYSMSRDDFEKLKELAIEFLNQSRSIVAPSKEEELVGFSLDCVLYQ